eukprot:12399084-Karenia_brevis.AAC.1
MASEDDGGGSKHKKKKNPYSVVDPNLLMQVQLPSKGRESSLEDDDSAEEKGHSCRIARVDKLGKKITRHSEKSSAAFKERVRRELSI